jgi:hypothetical protein
MQVCQKQGTNIGFSSSLWKSLMKNIYLRFMAKYFYKCKNAGLLIVSLHIHHSSRDKSGARRGNILKFKNVWLKNLPFGRKKKGLHHQPKSGKRALGGPLLEIDRCIFPKEDHLGAFFLPAE